MYNGYINCCRHSYMLSGKICGWRCPGCQNTTQEIPSVYKCFCGMDYTIFMYHFIYMTVFSFIQHTCRSWIKLDNIGICLSASWIIFILNSMFLHILNCGNSGNLCFQAFCSTRVLHVEVSFSIFLELLHLLFIGMFLLWCYTCTCNAKTK